MKKKTLLITFGILLVLAASGAVIAYTCILNRPLQIENNTFIYIDNDDNIDSVYYKLEKELQASAQSDSACLPHTAIMPTISIRELIVSVLKSELGIYSNACKQESKRL